MIKTENGGTTQPSLDALLSLAEAAKLSGLSASHLRLLVRRGEIWGIKLGRNWFTTKQAVEKYQAIGHKPGPKKSIGS
ncbi:MAG: helix-turn-helix domain-containing protein [Anaerolineae bacterium]